jgi:hypothetical protein
MTETNNVVRVVCKSVEFSNTFYNVNELNNTFQIDFSVDGPINITPVPEGFYTTSQIITIIEDDVSSQISAGETFTIEQDPLTQKLTFSINGPLLQTLQLWAAEDAPNGSTLSPSLGIVGTTNFVSNVTAQRTPYLYGATTVYIHTLGLAESNLVDGDVEVHDIIAEVPVTAPFGVMNYYESRDEELDSINYPAPRDSIDKIDIQIKDIDNNPLTLQGGNLTIVFKLYYL